MDHHYAGAYIEGNVFANIGGHGIRGLSGREHTITNNVFVNCSEGGTHVRDLFNHEKEFSVHVKGLSSVPYTSELWSKEFPGLSAMADILDDKEALALPVDHIYTKNLSVNCGEDGETGYFYGPLALQYAIDISNNYVTKENPGFKDLVNNDYTITSETLAGKITGFKTIEFDKMGRQ